MDRLTNQNVPLVLALTSYRSASLRERLLMALAYSALQRGGRVLIIEQGTPGGAHRENGALTDEVGIEGFPGLLARGDDGILYASLESASPADMYVALDIVSGTPPRFDLVLLHLRSDADEEMFLASLAHRVVVVTEPGEKALETVRAQMEQLAGEHRQRRFTLAVDDSPGQARRFYRQLLADTSSLLAVECDLLEGLPEGVTDPSVHMREYVAAADYQALLDSFWQRPSPLVTQGGLKLFWRCVTFCNECRLKVCRDVLANGQALEGCPVQRF